MCVDNDVLMDENAMGSLYSFLEQHGDVGIAGSKVYHMEEPDYVQQFGLKIDFDNFCTEGHYHNFKEDGSMPEYLSCDCVAACSLMIRRSLIKEIGFMPEENFLYWDDTEWCYRCTQAGYKVVSLGSSMVLHAMGAKRELDNTFPTYYAWRNWIKFFLKYTPENRLDAMAETFLDSMFQVVYQGIHKGKKNRSKMVMLAYDDAIHSIMGRAGGNRIFTLGYHIMWAEIPEGVKEICFCDSIFKTEDLSREKVYIDIENCVLFTEEDFLNRIHYTYSRRTFIAAQKPLFLQKIKETRDYLPTPQKALI